MIWLDFVFFAIIGLCALRGSALGVCHTLKGTLLTFVALSCSLWLGPHLLVWIGFHKVPTWALLTSFVLVALLGLLLLSWIGRFALPLGRGHVAHSSRVLALGVGAVHGVMVVAWIVMLISFTHKGRDHTFYGSWVCRTLQPTLHQITCLFEAPWRNNLLTWHRFLNEHPFVTQSYAPVVRLSDRT